MAFRVLRRAIGRCSTMKQVVPSKRFEVASKRTRIRLTVRGVVQGVGFRPFVYRAARRFALGGWVANTREGSVIEVEGDPRGLEDFRLHLENALPQAATLQSIMADVIPVEDESVFTIHTSSPLGETLAVIPPDLATCSECLAEIWDRTSRRYRYPFTTCTQCGPRYSIVTCIPYDRASTTMAQFPLCPACKAEYDDMADRRFHAEATACPACGPCLTLWDRHGYREASDENALRRTCDLIKNGQILAVKGLGGFQLWVDATSNDAVHRLRIRKHRPRKPFAVLFPSLEYVRRYCELSASEVQVLTSPEAPIVLLRKKTGLELAEDIAPGNPYLGALLPYTPLHHMLMAELNIPVVATSGNRSDEPIVIDEHEAVSRLGGIADAYLVHNRPIARPIDDSVVRVMGETLIVLRRARGYAPRPIVVDHLQDMEMRAAPIVALGGHLKNTVAVPSHS